MDIYFLGLITHALLEKPGGGFAAEGPDLEGDEAVMERVGVVYKATGHLSQLYVPRADGSGKHDCYELKGQVRFTPLADADPPAATPEVPSLTGKIFGGGDVHADVRNRTTGGDFVAFVYLVGGTYSVGDFYRNRGQFDDAMQRCIPRSVLWQVTPSPPSANVTITAEGLSVTVAPNARLFIMNLPPVAGDDDESHFDHYKVFLNGTAIDRPVELPDVRCELAGNPIELPLCPDANEPPVTTVECSNTQFP